METIQDLHFELIRRVSLPYHTFDGELVVNTLKEHRDLWKGAIMGQKDFFALHDICNDQWEANTLYIAPVIGKEDELKRLAEQKFKAMSVRWLGSPEDQDALWMWKQKGRVKKNTILACYW